MSTQAGIPLMAADADGTPFAIFQELVEKNGGSISKAPADPPEVAEPQGLAMIAFDELYEFKPSPDCWATWAESISRVTTGDGSVFHVAVTNDIWG